MNPSSGLALLAGALTYNIGLWNATMALNVRPFRFGFSAEGGARPPTNTAISSPGF